ncbi:MAG: SIMPL domain-containing protein, partial [Pseudomonadota bacterium]
GKVEGVPDMARVTVGVTTEAETAADALAENSRRLTAVFAALADAAIEDRDMQTSNLTLSPKWNDRLQNSRQSGRITGFVVSNVLRINVRDLTKLGGILDQVVSSGANQFQGLSFGLQDPDPAQDAARRAAVIDAARKAALYAEAAGVKLGRIVSIEENGGVRGPITMSMDMRAFAAESVPIAQGEVSVGATVTIVYELEE